MKVFVRHDRWVLVSLCIVLILAGSLCWPQTGAHLSRESYDRIKIGMAPVDVRLIMGHAPAPNDEETQFSREQWTGEWEEVAQDRDPDDTARAFWRSEVWLDYD